MSISIGKSKIVSVIIASILAVTGCTGENGSSSRVRDVKASQASILKTDLSATGALELTVASPYKLEKVESIKIEPNSVGKSLSIGAPDKDGKRQIAKGTGLPTFAVKYSVIDEAAATRLTCEATGVAIRGEKAGACLKSGDIVINTTSQTPTINPKAKEESCSGLLAKVDLDQGSVYRMILAKDHQDEIITVDAFDGKGDHFIWEQNAKKNIHIDNVPISDAKLLEAIKTDVILCAKDYYRTKHNMVPVHSQADTASQAPIGDTVVTPPTDQTSPAPANGCPSGLRYVKRMTTITHLVVADDGTEYQVPNAGRLGNVFVKRPGESLKTLPEDKAAGPRACVVGK